MLPATSTTVIQKDYGTKGGGGATKENISRQVTGGSGKSLSEGKRNKYSHGMCKDIIYYCLVLLLLVLRQKLSTELGVLHTLLLNEVHT